MGNMPSIIRKIVIVSVLAYIAVNMTADSESKLFDWKKGVNEMVILEYLGIPSEEQKPVNKSIINSVCDDGNTVYFETINGNYKASIQNKYIESEKYFNGFLDEQYSTLGGGLFFDRINDIKINIEEIVDLSKYYANNEAVTFQTQVDFCKKRVLLHINNKAPYSKYFLFNLEDHSYKFIDLENILKSKLEKGSIDSATAVLIDTDRILIGCYYDKRTKRKALIYDIDNKKILNEYNLDMSVTMGGMVGSCRVSPSGKYLLYDDEGQTPDRVYLYNLEETKEYTVVEYISNKDLFTFFNWDSEDKFFYGIHNTNTGERIIYSKQAGEFK